MAEEYAMAVSAIVEVIAAIAQVGTVAVLGFGVWIAFRQLDTWKREKLAVKRAELAEELVAITFELSAKFSAIRSPFGYGPPDDKDDDGTFDFFRRLEMLKELDDEFALLRQLKVRHRALIGESSAGGAIQIFFDARVQILLGINGKIRGIREPSQFGRPYTDAELKRSEKYDSLVWEGYAGESDPIKSLVDPALVEIESAMIPLIRLELDAG